jgi:hypothetical protein
MTITDSKLETYINSLTEDTTPDGANDLLLLLKAAGTLMKLKPDTLVSFAGGIPPSGWVGAAAMTYVGADDPTYTASMVGDVTTTYQPGQRIKLTQSTGGVKYFIITKVAYTSVTTFTLYGGTDYNLENEAITSPYYSPVKAPFGFPLDPTKWTVEVSDTTWRSQATPTQNVWYNINAAGKITVPIGCWNVSYQVAIFLSRSDDQDVQICTTLSTGNNTESDVDFTSVNYAGFSDTGITATSTTITVSRFKYLNLTSKTLYYLNSRTTYANGATLAWNNNISKMILRAVCAYL